MKILSSYEVRADIFDKILYDYAGRVKVTDNFEQYVFGYQDKKTIYYDGSEWLICRKYILDANIKNEDVTDGWKQLRLRRVSNANTVITKTISGTYATNYMNHLLFKYYSPREVEEILNNNEAEYNKDLIQYHYMVSLNVNELRKYDNCVKYDINGAHCDALVELFPKAAKAILKLHSKRKEKPEIKQIFNFYVGNLCNTGHRKTYNWIVQRTTRILYKAMDLTKGQLLYANTDGFVIRCPERKLHTSINLGEFKEEYSGDVYFYRSKNYQLMQCGEEMRGSCRNEVRGDIDLRKGIVVTYTQYPEYLDKENIHYIMKLKDIKREIIK